MSTGLFLDKKSSIPHFRLKIDLPLATALYEASIPGHYSIQSYIYIYIYIYMQNSKTMLNIEYRIHDLFHLFIMYFLRKFSTQLSVPQCCGRCRLPVRSKNYDVLCYCTADCYVEDDTTSTRTTTMWTKKYRDQFAYPRSVSYQ